MCLRPMTHETHLLRFPVPAAGNMQAGATPPYLAVRGSAKLSDHTWATYPIVWRCPPLVPAPPSPLATVALEGSCIIAREAPRNGLSKCKCKSKSPSRSRSPSCSRSCATLLLLLSLLLSHALCVSAPSPFPCSKARAPHLCAPQVYGCTRDKAEAIQDEYSTPLALRQRFLSLLRAGQYPAAQSLLWSVTGDTSGRQMGSSAGSLIFHTFCCQND